MKKKMLYLIAISILTMIVMLIIQNKVSAAEKYITIQFDDGKFYYKIKSLLKEEYKNIKIEKEDDINRKIELKEDDIKSIKRIWIDDENGSIKISSIKGIGNFKHLDYLSLYGANIGGELSDLTELDNLSALYLINTNIEGKLSDLTELDNLRELYLINTNIEGNLSDLRDLSKLNILILRGNKNIEGNSSDLSNLNLLEFEYDGNNNTDTPNEEPKPSEEPSDKPTDKPSDKPSEEPSYKPNDKPITNLPKLVFNVEVKDEDGDLVSGTEIKYSEIYLKGFIPSITTKGNTVTTSEKGIATITIDAPQEKVYVAVQVTAPEGYLDYDKILQFKYADGVWQFEHEWAYGTEFFRKQ